MTPPVNRMPADPTANAAPRLLNNAPLQLFEVVRSATVMAPGVVGKVSVNVAPVKATELLFARTICKVDTPVFGRIGLVRNDLEMVGAARTVISAVAAVPLDPAEGPPAGMVLPKCLR